MIVDHPGRLHQRVGGRGTDEAEPTAFQFALTWLAYQGDITRNDATLRAYCDITASVAILDLLVTEIAGELRPGKEEEIAAKLADATGSWRDDNLL